MRVTDEIVEAGLIAYTSARWYEMPSGDVVRNVLTAALAAVEPEPPGESLDDFATWFDEDQWDYWIGDPHHYSPPMSEMVIDYRATIRRRTGTEGVRGGE